MKISTTAASIGVLAGFAASAVADHDHGSRQRIFRAQMVGYNEVLSVSSPAKGTFYAILNKDGNGFTYWLTYSDLQFDVSQAHIHFGQHHQNGGISVWLCRTTTLPNPPPAGAGDVPLCGGPRSGSVTGSIVASEVVGPAGQGIAPGEFAELLAAMRSGAAYANVHSGVAGIPADPTAMPPVPATAPIGFPGGEIRGQID
jgi:hypothetical protein